MAALTTNLREFLVDVVQGPYPVVDILSDDFYNEFFYFDGMYYDDPSTLDVDRVRSVCQIEDEDLIKEIWKRAVRDHFEISYMDDYYEAIIEEIEKVVTKGFEDLTDFFGDDLEEAGVSIEQLPKFKVRFDWEDDKLTIEGDLTALELILIEIMRGFGWRYESLDEFIACNGQDQTKRFQSHLQYLGEIESVYGTSYYFFMMDDITEFEKYRCFGNGDVTDQELLEAMCI